MNDPFEGGFVIVRPKRRRYTYGQKIGIQFMSDLHIGHAEADLNLMNHELDEARTRNDRIVINGDIIDLILPKDKKRFDPQCLHSRIRGRTDVINATIDLAFDVLSPYADLIDMMGIGNHETAVMKYHSVDPILILIERLNETKLAKDKNHKISYGGYQGYIDYRWATGTQSDTKRYVIYYYHGKGGSSGMSKGMNDLGHLASWVKSDLIWIGHKHNHFADDCRVVECPISGYKPKLKVQKRIMTGSYFHTYHGQTQESIRRNGRKSNWAADMAFAPQGLGGIRMELEFRSDGIRARALV